LVVALGIAEASIAAGARETGALPGTEPRMILLIVASPRDTASYLQTVAAFARMLARDNVAEALASARSPAEVLALPALREHELEGQLLVRDVMRAQVVALQPDDTLDAAARTLGRVGADALPVVAEGGQVVGLLSYRELLRQFAPGYVQRATGAAPARQPPDPRTLRVRDAMARSVFCVSEEQTVADAAHLLTSRDVERVPVVADGVLRGFLTRADLVHRLLGSR
jgi:CBS domain-containing protein